MLLHSRPRSVKLAKREPRGTIQIIKRPNSKAIPHFQHSANHPTYEFGKPIQTKRRPGKLLDVFFFTYPLSSLTSFISGKMINDVNDWARQSPKKISRLFVLYSALWPLGQPLSRPSHLQELNSANFSVILNPSTVTSANHKYSPQCFHKTRVWLTINVITINQNARSIVKINMVFCKICAGKRFRIQFVFDVCKYGGKIDVDGKTGRKLVYALLTSMSVPCLKFEFGTVRWANHSDYYFFKAPSANSLWFVLQTFLICVFSVWLLEAGSCSLHSLMSRSIRLQKT